LYPLLHISSTIPSHHPVCTLPLISNSSSHHRHPPSSPTRRSSDLCLRVGQAKARGLPEDAVAGALDDFLVPADRLVRAAERGDQDRKRTGLNSSHVEMSYAVFCLKREKTM